MAGKRIMPRNLTGKEKLTYIVDEVFLAYNSARLKEACQLFADRMLDADVTIGMSISGALTPAGLGCSSIIPMIKAGFIDWIVSTGANLYHDMHFALNYRCTRAVSSLMIPTCATTTWFASTTSSSPTPTD
jgi:deoxyhypusine synthase